MSGRSRGGSAVYGGDVDMVSASQRADHEVAREAMAALGVNRVRGPAALLTLP